MPSVSRPAPQEDMCPRGIPPRSSVSYGPKYPMSLPGHRRTRRAAARRQRLWPGNDIGYFGPYETLLRGGMPRGHMSSCGAGRLTLGIEADGAIKGCPSLPSRDYVGGNVRDVA